MMDATESNEGERDYSATWTRKLAQAFADEVERNIAAICSNSPRTYNPIKSSCRPADESAHLQSVTHPNVDQIP